MYSYICKFWSLQLHKIFLTFFFAVLRLCKNVCNIIFAETVMMNYIWYNDWSSLRLLSSIPEPEPSKVKIRLGKKIWWVFLAVRSEPELNPHPELEPHRNQTAPINVAFKDTTKKMYIKYTIFKKEKK